ncbi:dysbindin domain-containing protein 1 isoform X1 [Sinocyclocheilus grahami]|uniref:Dysbindin domain-containing protein 1 n=1 Tax=Sinocyclocheilus grahami TaxID=75366 RepID=A0A672L0Q8_SINGR|nr:PREDICTED: dysbindin domain-containing protein 1-like isoform X1 [Sinocyclocheilus grahami]
MEAQADSGAAEPLRDREFQKLLKSSSSASLTSEASHNASGERVGTPAHHGSQVLINEKRQPLSSVSSLEVHFDLLDLTELTDMSDQELGEVFADSDEENQTESPAIHPADRQQPPLPRFPHSGYVRSPSWTRGGKGEQQPRDRKHHSDSENTEPMLKIERSQSQQP